MAMNISLSIPLYRLYSREATFEMLFFISSFILSRGARKGQAANRGIWLALQPGEEGQQQAVEDSQGSGSLPPGAPDRASSRRVTSGRACRFFSLARVAPADFKQAQ